jgi:hypothetical protein
LGNPIIATAAEYEERAREIFQYKLVMADKTANQLHIGTGSAYSAFHDNMQFHAACARWVPKKLTD